ncbi:MAG: GDP-mannose mannosyl hydrolase [Candidatus Thiodiazotropha sp.]|jgi:colanic acid biosynthesis protein WcaH
MLDRKEFLKIVESTPLVSIDLIVRNDQAEVLLGRRNNAPAMGYWFVPGGRIMKSESLSQAFERITLTELGESFDIGISRLIGVFEHHYADNLANDAFGTHYIAMGMQLQITDQLPALPCQQHARYQWMAVDVLLNDPQVHQNTKDYFIASRGLRV